MSGLLYMMLFTCFFFNGIKIGTSLVNGNMEMHSAYNLGYIHIYIYSNRCAYLFDLAYLKMGIANKGHSL